MYFFCTSIGSVRNWSKAVGYIVFVFTFIWIWLRKISKTTRWIFQVCRDCDHRTICLPKLNVLYQIFLSEDFKNTFFFIIMSSNHEKLFIWNASIWVDWPCIRSMFRVLGIYNFATTTTYLLRCSSINSKCYDQLCIMAFCNGRFDSYIWETPDRPVSFSLTKCNNVTSPLSKSCENWVRKASLTVIFYHYDRNFSKLFKMKPFYHWSLL